MTYGAGNRIDRDIEQALRDEGRTTRGTTMEFSRQAEMLKDAFQTHLAPFDPSGEGGLATAGLLAGLPGVFDEFGASLRAVADRMGDGPFQRAAQEVLHELAAATSGLRDRAAESSGQFERDHENELNRLRNPRPQEQAWDTARN
jgi:hypothetical protein